MVEFFELLTCFFQACWAFLPMAHPVAKTLWMAFCTKAHVGTAATQVLVFGDTGMSPAHVTTSPS